MNSLVLLLCVGCIALDLAIKVQISIVSGKTHLSELEITMPHARLSQRKQSDGLIKVVYVITYMHEACMCLNCGKFSQVHFEKANDGN